MASEVGRKSQSSAGTSRSKTSGLNTKLNLVEQVKAIAAANARAPLNTEENLLLFLRSWWSRTYNKPLKDPLLAEYSIEDLLYEFYDKIERAEAEDEQRNLADDKIEVDKDKANLDWAEQEEKRELEELAKKKVAKETEPVAPVNPIDDPDNKKWMEEQLAKAKAELGEDFGENLIANFEE